MKRTSSLLFLCIFLLDSSIAAAQQRSKPTSSRPKVSQPKEASTSDKSASEALQKLLDTAPVQMKDEEKLRLWKNPEKVLILRNNTLWDSKFDPQNRRSGDLLSAEKYAGKAGIIVDPDNFVKGNWFHILFDDTKETVKSNCDKCVGFLSEMEIAQSYVGKSFWARGHCTMQDVANNDRIEIPNLVKLTISRITWGDGGEIGDRFFIYFKNSEGRELALGWPHYGNTGFAPQYFQGWCSTMTSYFYPKDPRELFPRWSRTIWQLIEKGEVALGMTTEMAKLACPDGLEQNGEMKPIGVSLEGGKLSTIHQCGDRKFVIEGGKVSKYIFK